MSSNGWPASSSSPIPSDMGSHQSSPSQKSLSLPATEVCLPPRIENPPHESFTNAVYYPNWRVYNNQPPSSFSLQFVSHVFYAFAWVRADGAVYLKDEWVDCDMPVDGATGALRAWVQAKQQYPHLKIILSIGGGGPASDAFEVIAGNSMAMDRFRYTAKILVDQYCLDGVDVDWEHPNHSEQGINYVNLLARLRDHLPSPQYIITSALPAEVSVLRNIDLSAAQTYLDFLNIMAYDFYGPWTHLTGHHAQLYAPARELVELIQPCGNTAVQYALHRGVPSKKILLGIPVYGWSFSGAAMAGQTYDLRCTQGLTFEYRDLPRPEADKVYAKHCAAVASIGGDGGFVSYDDVKTVKEKGAFAARHQLGGLFYWHIGGDRTGEDSLVQNGFKALHGFS